MAYAVHLYTIYIYPSIFCCVCCCCQACAAPVESLGDHNISYVRSNAPTKYGCTLAGLAMCGNNDDTDLSQSHFATDIPTGDENGSARGI